jgi:hypothetical protein
MGLPVMIVRDGWYLQLGWLLWEELIDKRRKEAEREDQ